MKSLKTLLIAASGVLYLTACSVPVPFGKPEDRLRMQQDLHLRQAPSVLIPLKWNYFDYGVPEKGGDPQDTVALIQPGVLTLIGYEHGRYIRQAEFASKAVDCLYVFKGIDSGQPLWLLRADRPVYLGIGNGRGWVNQPLRKRFVEAMAQAGFPLHADAQGKSYAATGDSHSALVLNQFYGSSIQEVAENRYFNVCAKPKE